MIKNRTGPNTSIRLLHSLISFNLVDTSTCMRWLAMATVEDDEYEIPLRDQRIFGAGVKRKRIQFVQSTLVTASTLSLPATPSASAADRYLSIVLNKAAPSTRAESAPPTTAIAEDAGSRDERAATRSSEEGQRQDEVVAECEICHRPMSALAAKHESSIAHQICVQHSYPPSHVDRTRKGLAVLEGQGWDPDSRLGLGAGGEGRLHPVKATENPERAGLGARFDRMKAVEKQIRLDAGKVKLMEKEGKKRAESLRNAFYRSEEVERYLGQEQTNAALDMKAFKRSKGGR